MNIIAILFILMIGMFSIYLCYLKSRSILSYGTFYCALWMIIGILSNSGLMDYYLPSALINICIIVSMIVMTLTYAGKGKRYLNKPEYVLSIDKTIRYKLIIVANIIAFIYMIPFFLKAISVIGNQGWIYLRMISGSASEELGTSDISTIILQSVCYPLIMVSVFLAIIAMFLRANHASKLLVVSLVNITAYSFINGSRNGFVTIIVFATFAYFRLLFPLQRQRVTQEGRNHKFFFAVVIVAVVAIILFISQERSSHSLSFLENSYIYFAGGPSYVTQLIKNMNEYTINKDFLLGSATFGFIYNIIALVSRYFGVNIPISDYIINSQLASKAYAISPTVSANAMTTVFFPFLMDWGYLGIIIGPVLISIVTLYIERKSMTEGNMRWVTFGVFWYYFIYRTIFKYDGISISFFFIIFFLLLFTSTNDNRKILFGRKTII